MGKHKDNDRKDSGGISGYEAKHSGGWDVWDWAQHSNATAETQQIPKVTDKKGDRKRRYASKHAGEGRPACVTEVSRRVAKL